MEPSFSQHPEITKGLTDSLYGRIGAIKDVDSGSDSPPTGDARHPSLIGQRTGSFDDGDEEKHTEEEFEADTSSQAPENEAASISFGALVKTQASLGKRNRSSDDDSYDPIGKRRTPCHFTNDEALERRAGKKDTRDFLRTSKHAPTELSSKKAVSRKREVVPTLKLNHRDPRFEPFSGVFDERKTKKNYSFLDTYRDSEILDLQSAIRKAKDGEGKEQLKRALLSMESRRKAQKIREQQQEVLRKHRKEEKEKIEQGKRPFYLKKADQKKMALIERFEGMKGKQVDKVIERRRKKKAAKERKAMPNTRRV